jgi:hypothetical protein
MTHMYMIDMTRRNTTNSRESDKAKDMFYIAWLNMEFINKLGLFYLLSQKYIDCNKYRILKTDTLTSITLNLGV